MSDNPDAPVGEAEREAAVERLVALHREGLLGPHDFEDRRGRARDARTRGELQAIFRDLIPEDGGPRGAEVVGARPPASGSAAPAAQTWFTKPRRDALSGIVVFAAVLLFFRTGSWLWFLMIPAAPVLWQLFSGREND